MPSLSHPSYYQITSIFHFFALNLNSSPNNVTAILSHVPNPPYYTTLNTFGVLLEKNALLNLYLHVVHYTVNKVHLFPTLLTFLLHIFPPCSPSLHRLHPKHYILSASFRSRLIPVFRSVTSTNAYVPFAMLSLLVLMVSRMISCTNFDLFLQNRYGYCLGVLLTRVFFRLHLNLAPLDPYLSLVIQLMFQTIVP